MDKQTITALFAWLVLGPEFLAFVSCCFFGIISKELAGPILLLSVGALKTFADFYGLGGLQSQLHLFAVYLRHDLDLSYLVVFGPGTIVGVIASVFGLVRPATVISCIAMFVSFRITLAGIVAFYAEQLDRKSRLECPSNNVYVSNKTLKIKHIDFLKNIHDVGHM